MMARLAVIAGALMAATIIALPVAGWAIGGEPTSFYSASSDEIARKPGSLIRREPMPGAPDGATAYRILYRSVGLHGEPIAVSGFVVIPEQGDRRDAPPVVAWAHPTSGVVPKCAPSLTRLPFDNVQGLEEMLKRGFVVVATDYPGLGTPSVHPYLIGDSEGRAVLDSVRAARELAGADGRFISWGHSQGGQAAIYAGLMARQYAPELKPMGVAAAAPATDLATLLRDDFTTAGGKNLTAMALWSWNRLYPAPMERILAPGAVDTVNRLSEECIESLFDILEREHTEKPLNEAFLTIPDITTVEPWKSLISGNSPPPLPSDIPVFLAQGTTDLTVRPAVTQEYKDRLCRDGSRVRMLSVPNVGHAFIARDAAVAAVDWMQARFDGETAPSDC